MNWGNERWGNERRRIRVRPGGRNLIGLNASLVALEKKVAALEPLVTIDPLTKLLNIEGMWREIWRLCADVGRSNSADGLAFVYYDAISFKKANDHLGHSNGNLILRHLADSLRNHHREGDPLVRFGGDESLAVMKIGSERDANKIVFESRRGKEWTLPPILESVNQDMRDFMQDRFPAFVREYGDKVGTFRAGVFYLDNRLIMTSSPQQLESLISTGLNQLSLRVKGHDNWT